MKICKLYIKALHQFESVEIDLTNPLTGEPLDKICFIGRNGTGKSKLLLLLQWFLTSGLKSYSESKPIHFLSGADKSKIVIEFFYADAKYFAYYDSDAWHRQVTILNAGQIPLEYQKNFIKDLLEQPNIGDTTDFIALTAGLRHSNFVDQLVLRNNSKDLLIYSPAESQKNGYGFLKDVPDVTLNSALTLFSNFLAFHVVSQETLVEFWKLLIYNIKRLDEEREKFENAPQNINKTKAQLIDEFNRISPRILEGISLVWNKILGKAGLEFDVDGASKPIQLNDTFNAYIRLKSSKKLISYNALSTGIRNFIFRIGHIYSLYFSREIDRGFLIVDEPENSLFPDFLFDLVETYQQIILDKRGQNNTQMFFATHNPIVAAQFEPYERIILDWQDAGTVSIRRGASPVGDDPNDVLSNDFMLKDLMGPEGRKMWEIYESLKKSLIRAKTNQEKERLINEINDIGMRYNFS